MRYQGVAQNLVLLNENNEAKHGFDRGVLIVGSVVDSGTDNQIEPSLSSSDLSLKMKVLPSLASKSSDWEKIGMNYIFWEAPELSVAEGNETLVAGNFYRVLRGEIVTAAPDETTFKAGQRFKCVASNDGSFTGSGVVALDVPEEFYKPLEHDQRAAAQKVAFADRGDEFDYNSQSWNTADSVFGDVR